MYHIHAKDCGDKFMFRVWDNIHSKYLTNELSEADVICWLREEAITAAQRQFERRISRELGRAYSTGSSHPMGRSKGRMAWEKTFAEEMLGDSTPDGENRLN